MDQLIYKPGTTELCIKAVPEDLVEPALMMVVSMLARKILSTDIHYDITRGENTRVSRPDKACRARSADPPTQTVQLPKEDGRLNMHRKGHRNLRCDSSFCYRNGRITYESAQTSRFCEAGRPQELRRSEKCRYGYQSEVL